MSSENLQEVLEALDQKVDSLLATIRNLEEENLQLKEDIGQVTRERDELSQTVSSSDGNKEELRNRIQSIIAKIEQLEAQ